MKTKLLIILVLVCLLSACSNMNSHATDVDLIVQHDALIKHFEEEAEQIQIKIGEHKKFLSQFESKSYVYGRHTEDLKAHSQEVINLFEEVVAENRKMVEMLRDEKGLKCKIIRGKHRWEKDLSRIQQRCQD
jgi:peptidoglycan hydrolase CwlO-like protein